MKRFNVFEYFFFSVNRVPFDAETYLGFYIELFLQMFTVHFYMLIFSSTISIFYAFHKFITGLVIDYSMAMEKFDEKLNDEIQQKSDRHRHSVKVRLETRQFLKESVDLHFGILKYKFFKRK